MKVGFVSLLGRPNVGKSTLMNKMLGIKLAITSNKVGTTRNIINGIYNDEDSQIIFVDTPGISKPLSKLESILNKKSYANTQFVDIILFLVDTKSGIGRGDKYILDKLDNKEIPVFLVLNKIDKLKRDELLKIIDESKELYPFKEIVPISSLKGDNLKELKKTIKKYLPEQEKIFTNDELTNVSKRFIASEVVREKILELTHNEIPHTVTCYTEHFKEKKDVIEINVLIVIERENLKKIIIGKEGSLLKEVGKRARYDLEKFYGKKVYLETFVKTIKNWKDEEKYLIELGLKEDE